MGPRLTAMTTALAVGLLAAVLPTSAGATTADERPSAVVAMGDSYLSGEAGRWEGNSATDRGDRRGTDRAAYRAGWGWWRYDEARVYGESGASGCHRSDVAPIVASAIDVDALINLACSGAATANLVRAEAGGRGLNGEPSQADQLAEVARTHDVELIVVSIGGNDLGFGDIVLDCAVDYLLSPSWSPNTCNEEKQRAIDAAMATVMADVGTVLDEIRAVMETAGYPADAYRLVLQTYPSPIPSGDEFRYRQSGWTRTFTGGCPFWDVDATWARDTFVPQLSANLSAVAADRGVEVLDVADALEGREVCAEGRSQGAGPDAEWGRFLVSGLIQGEAQESLHPNALGQQALGTCLRLLYDADPGRYRCATVGDAGPETMSLTPR